MADLNLAVIGNSIVAALVDRRARIVWYCLPRFDGDPVFSSLLDGDKPYRFAVEPGATETLIEIPVDWALDDWEQYAFYPGVTGSGVIESPAKVLEMWTLEAEAHHAEGGCFVLTNHPFISGRPSKAVALERLIENVKAMDGMWVSTLAEIAEHADRTCEHTYVHTRFEVPAFPDVPIRRTPGS